ncbi:hypothetical protein ACCO45_010059 [Purpureocillium lilacinum]|uniref:Uncharacterized protein n=1 Tax=Purpureocillium lilacinum TaxID=33203 RepID=A0ACC4DDS7_PURLI
MSLSRWNPVQGRLQKAYLTAVSPTPHPSPHGQNGHLLSPPLDVDELLLSLAEAYEDDDTAAQTSGANGVVPDSIRMSHNQQTVCNGNRIRNIAGQIGNITYLS